MIATPIDATKTCIKMQLGHVGESAASTPDVAEIELGPDLLQLIAKGILAVQGAGVPTGEMVLPMPAPFRLLDSDDEEFDSGDGEAKDFGCFQMSSAWLSIEGKTLSLEIWDKHSDDELHGRLSFGEVDGLAEKIRAAVALEMSSVLKRLSGV